MDFEKQGPILICTLHLVTLSLVRHIPWKTPVCLRTDIPGITDLLLLGLVTNLACEPVSTNHKLQPLALMRVLQHSCMDRASTQAGGPGPRGAGWGQRAGIWERKSSQDGWGGVAGQQWSASTPQNHSLKRCEWSVSVRVPAVVCVCYRSDVCV